MEVVIIPLGEVDGKERFILYRPMLGIAFVGNPAMVRVVEAFSQGGTPASPEAAQFLEEIGFLEPDPPAPELGRVDFEPAAAVLLMTNQCQLRCVYCYAAAGENPKQELAFAIAKTVIDAVVKNAQQRSAKQFSLSFHGGGEPVKAWKALQDCVAYARSQPLPADITLTSNGLWSRAQTEWILANINGISLSIDGSPATQDRQRPTRGGKNSSALAMRSCAALDQHGFNYGIRMTATAPWTSLPEDVRYLCEHTRCNTIQVEPAFNTGRSGHAQPAVEEAQEFVEALLQAYDAAEAYQRKFYYAGARLGWVTDVFCAAPYNALIVTPQGDLVTCYEVTDREHPFAELSTIGRVEGDAIILDLDKRQRLHTRMAERRASCRDCICYWSCAGNCYTRAFGAGADGNLEKGQLCQITRTLTRELLLRQISKGNGVWRRQTAPAPGQVIYAPAELGVQTRHA